MLGAISRVPVREGVRVAPGVEPVAPVRVGVADSAARRFVRAFEMRRLLGPGTFEPALPDEVFSREAPPRVAGGVLWIVLEDPRVALPEPVAGAGKRTRRAEGWTFRMPIWVSAKSRLVERLLELPAELLGRRGGVLEAPELDPL